MCFSKHGKALIPKNYYPIQAISPFPHRGFPEGCESWSISSSQSIREQWHLHAIEQIHSWGSGWIVWMTFPILVCQISTIGIRLSLPTTLQIEGKFSPGCNQNLSPVLACTLSWGRTEETKWGVPTSRKSQCFQLYSTAWPEDPKAASF